MTALCCAVFSCCRPTACCSFCFCSERAGAIADCASAPEQSPKRISRQRERQVMSLKTDHVFYHSLEAAADIHISHEHKFIVQFHARCGPTLTGPGICLSHIQIEPVKDGSVLGRLALPENLAIKLRDKEHGGPTG